MISEYTLTTDKNEIQENQEIFTLLEKRANKYLN